MERSYWLAMLSEIGIQLLRSLESFIEEDFGGAVDLLVIVSISKLLCRSFGKYPGACSPVAVLLLHDDRMPK